MLDDGNIHVCEDYILVAQLYRCPDCGGGICFLPKYGPPLSKDSGEYNSCNFFCFTCHEDGKMVDQTRLETDEVAIERVVKMYIEDPDMLAFVGLTLFSEANR